jgi:hypothetical protein
VLRHWIAGMTIPFAVFTAQPLRAADSGMNDLDSLNAAVCIAAVGEIGKLAASASKEKPVLVLFRDQAIFPALPPNADAGTAAAYKSMIEAEAKLVVAPPSLRTCVRDHLAASGANVVFDESASADESLHVVISGGRINGDSGTADFSSGIMPMHHHRGGRSIGRLELHRENGGWVYDRLRYHKFLDLCPEDGCT